MKNPFSSLPYFIFGVLLMSLGVYFLYLQAPGKILQETQAITLIKTAYPEFKNYPNDTLPPQRIQTEKATNGWYVAFVQLGSGRPLLGATCFFIRNDGNIKTLGKFVPSLQDTTFSLKTCTN